MAEPEIKKYTVEEPYLKINCALGEAPFWEEATNTLRFVDIVKCKVYTIDLDKGPSSLKELARLSTSVGTTADIEGNDKEFVFGGKRGYGILNKETAEYRYIKEIPWDEEEAATNKAYRMRSNDGAVDCKGRYWVGVMNDQLITSFKPEGVLCRLDPDGSFHRMMEKVTIPNGISWTPDNRTMYFADSPTKNIFAFDFDAEAGTFSNKRVFFHVDHPDGVPDGHCLDEEGYMWSAIHGTGKVVRISPQGRVVAEISVPTRCPTCPGFAGKDLYITSAEEEEPERFPESKKYQGSLFKCHVGVRGIKLHRFKYQPQEA